MENELSGWRGGLHAFRLWLSKIDKPQVHPDLEGMFYHYQGVLDEAADHLIPKLSAVTKQQPIKRKKLFGLF